MDGSRTTSLVGLLAFALLLIVRNAGAQMPVDESTSIGISNPNSTQPVRAYRLPTWHWSTWTLRANGETHRHSKRREGRDSASEWESESFSARLTLQPRYRAFWESVERRAFLRFSPRLSLDRSGSSGDPDDLPVQERDHLRYGGGFGVRGTLQEYVTGRAFLLTDAEGLLNYSRSQTARKQPSVSGQAEQTQTTIDFDVRTHLRLGIGVGRVRVVTPVIRALRVRERLRAVAPGSSVSDQQVQAAARQLARRPGYQAVYDRPDKYFWRGFFDRAGLSGQSPFEAFYVADVLREPVGVRREGSEFSVGPSGSYERDLHREEMEGDLQERDFEERGTVGGFAHGQWYRNLSLRHQLGADVEATYTHFVESQGPLDHEVGTRAEGQWLWVVADRIRLDTRLRADLRSLHDPQAQGEFRPRNRYTLSSNVLVFVENSLFLTAGANVRYGYSGISQTGSASDFRAGLQFRVDYVLSRVLE